MSSRRSDVLSGLKTAGRAGLSGEVLACELGISRAAIAKHIAALRALGYGITAQAGVGYVLESVPDIPLAEEIAAALRSGFWESLRFVEQTGSTNDDCKELARAGAPQGTAVIAAQQREGRGRLGRSWASPAGGVYLSALLRPTAPLAELAPLSLVISLGVARGLESIGATPRLKWPNDVWLARGKLSGVLLETSAEADRADWVVAGVGINVRRPGDPLSGAAYLDDPREDGGAMPPPGLAVVAAAALDGIAWAYGEFGGGGFGALAAEYEKRSMLPGHDVTVRDLAGNVLADGRAAGIDGTGRLLVEQDGTSVAIAAGDVSLRPTRD